MSHSRELFDAPSVAPEILRKVMILPAPEMKIVLHFLSTKKTSDGTVLQSGQAIAGEIGMNRSLYARKIKDVLEAGWVAFASREQNITYYRLGPEAGETETATVIPFRSRAAS
ncbi:hypothetical protein [Kitasatospora sp. NPDC086791]|uniref:hypothetical protein n=1 Tax=Kitasatospora sp. NPDC086791 TaxID=3155178 RepID=UPI0034153B0C